MSAKINQYISPVPKVIAGIRYFSLPKAAERLNLMICPLRSPTDASFSCLHIIPTNIILMIRDGTCVG